MKHYKIKYTIDNYNLKGSSIENYNTNNDLKGGMESLLEGVFDPSIQAQELKEKYTAKACPSSVTRSRKLTSI